MRLALLALSFLLVSSAAKAACAPELVLKNLRAKESSYYTPGLSAKVTLKATLQPGESKNTLILIDDFTFTNETAKPAELYSIVGSSYASEVTAWAVLVDAGTCQINSAREVLHTGGGGL